VLCLQKSFGRFESEEQILEKDIGVFGLESKETRYLFLKIFFSESQINSLIQIFRKIINNFMMNQTKLLLTNFLFKNKKDKNFPF